MPETKLLAAGDVAEAIAQVTNLKTLEVYRDKNLKLKMMAILQNQLWIKNQ